MVERNSVRVGLDEDRLIQQFENALGCRHGGLENVEFFAEVLNRPEEALREHRERGEDAESKPAGENAVAAGPINQSDGGEAEKLDRGIEESVSENGIAPGQHVVAIALLEFIHGLAFAVEELHDAHAGNVFLEESVDAGDGGADAAVGVAHELAEDHGYDQDAGEDGESVQGEAAVNLEEEHGHDHEEEEVVDHGNDACGEKIVEGVDVRGYARDQAADGVAVEVAHRQTLHVAEYFAAHVVHGLLADALHDANLDVLGEEVERKDSQQEKAKPADARPSGRFGDEALELGNKVLVDTLLKNQRRRELKRGDDGDHDESEGHAPFVRLHVLQKPAHQARIVRFAEGLFFVQVAHARSSSSSSNCFWYKSA